jgi:phosphoglycolate phosphatase
MLKHVILDLDGTLIDSAPSILKCLESTLNFYQLKPLFPLNNLVIGPPLELTFQKLTGIKNLLVIDELIDFFKNLYDVDGYKDSIPYDGISQLLRELSSLNFFVYLATNKRIVPTKKILEHLLWSNYFDAVYAFDTGTIKFKSKAEMLSSILKDNNVDTVSAVYVGDINSDYEAAQKNKIKFIFANWGYEEKLLCKYPIVASNPGNLTQILLNQL